MKKYVLFESFHGKYSDNPKYISEKLHELDSSINIVWSIDSDSENCPNYVIKVKPKSIMYYYYREVSLVMVDNYIGMISHYGRHFGWLLGKIAKRRNRLNISTWHGTPLKKIGADLVQNKRKEGFFTTSDLLIAGCIYTQKCLSRSIYNSVPVLLSGTPRNDVFFKKIDCTKIKELLGIPNNMKVCLFAPTYRNSIAYSGLNQLKEMNIPILLETLQHTFGGEWVFVYRFHHEVEVAVSNTLGDIQSDKIINGNLHSDMATYLSVTDVLITDYSGSLFDFALTKKPCFLFAPDIQLYNQSPGMYMDIYDLPFDIVFNFDDLLSKMVNYSFVSTKNKIDLFLKNIGNVEDGMASEKIALIILDFIKHRNKERIRMIENETKNKFC